MKRRPPGRSRPRHDVAPALDVGQPAERADPREDEVEAALAEDVGGRVDVGLDELRRRPRSAPRADGPPRARRGRSRARSSARRAARARSCPSRCGTGGARLRGRRRRRAAAGRSARRRSDGRGRRGTARGRSRPRRRAPGRARPSWRGSRFRGRSPVHRGSWRSRFAGGLDARDDRGGAPRLRGRVRAPRGNAAHTGDRLRRDRPARRPGGARARRAVVARASRSSCSPRRR